MSDRITRRSVVKGVLAGSVAVTATVASIDLAHALSAPDSKKTGAVQFHRYVFASDPRAGTGGFRVMPG